MNLKNKNESKIVILACLFTVFIVIGFSLMQGSIKSNKSDYAVKKSDTKNIELTKDDYEIIKKDEKNNVKIFVVLEKRNLNPKETACLANELGEKLSGKFKVYLFDDKNKAANFEYKTEQIQKIVKPIDSKKVEIEEYHITDKELEVEPQYYVIKNIDKKDGKTNIEIELKNTDEPETVLAQIKFLAENIKNLNHNKDLGILEINAFYEGGNSPSWKYTSRDKNLIINSQIINL